MADTGQTHGEQKSGYLPSLDGWRTVAILMVVAAHQRPWRLGLFHSQWLHGGRGVRLFFALSGLLICTRLLREEQRFGGISLRSFYTRRLFRIQPAALFYLAVISMLMLAGELPRVWSAVLGSALMVRTFLPRTATNWETAHFWSLAVEEQFYLFLPGFLVLCRRRRLALLSALVVAFDVWLWWSCGRPGSRDFPRLFICARTWWSARFFLVPCSHSPCSATA